MFLSSSVVAFLIGCTIGHQLKGCSPVEDGGSLTLVFTFNETKMDIFWTIKYPGGAVENVSLTCDDIDLPCTEVWSDRLSLAFINQTGESTLRLRLVGVRDHGAEINCNVKDEAGTETILTCPVQVYRIPENTSCQAVKFAENGYNVSCTAGKVFPGLKCLFDQYEINLRQKVTLPSEEIKIIEEPVGEGYLRATCQINVYSINPGKYQIFPLLQTNLSSPVRIKSVPVHPTNPIFVFNSTQKVHLFRDELAHANPYCQTDTQKTGLVCEAHGFETSPALTLLVDGSEASPLTSVIIETSSVNIYRWSFALDSALNVTGRKLVCLAKAQDKNILVTTEAAYDNLKNINSIIPELIEKLTCQGLRSDHHDSALKIACLKKDKVIFTSNARGDQAELSLELGLDASQCYCVYEDKKNCFTHTMPIVIAEMSPTLAEDGQEDVHIRIVIIINIAVLFLIALLFVIISFIRKNRHKSSLFEGKGEHYKKDEMNKDSGKSLMKVEKFAIRDQLLSGDASKCTQFIV